MECSRVGRQFACFQIEKNKETGPWPEITGSTQHTLGRVL